MKINDNIMCNDFIPNLNPHVQLFEKKSFSTLDSVYILFLKTTKKQK